ncbi:crotonase/enoyl-CoA hydratase family protein [Cryptosporangium phraense]|uniref:Crotonase/enoyl-CoA hydratase family protein n=1 Tax=Cryptosporangium phraense TaxID=2593070 RepID=A0A545AWN9_9ACTN|nr:crotonase/enoyl-CoA hydratase family protein [Cryptosporangium phraense]TQS45746.1 crotonase/enoyl-CoA hydratase family protein [Cryptosporangium phraense]
MDYEFDEKLTALEATRHGTDGAVVRVTLLGPGKGNAMGPAFWAETPRLFRALSADESVRAIVITGSGPHFTYGLDLTSFASGAGSTLADDGGLARARTRFLYEIREMQTSLDEVAACRKPVAAAISGWCIGGGIDLLAACDVRFGSADAKFSIREVRMAIVADMGSLARLPGILSEGHLRELALTGRDFDAAKAERIGLLNEVLASPEEAVAAAHAFADEIAANPPLVVQGVKEVLDVNRAERVAAAQRYVTTWNAAFLPSHDLTEAMTAFAQRRAPEFGGR